MAKSTSNKPTNKAQKAAPKAVAEVAAPVVSETVATVEEATAEAAEAQEETPEADGEAAIVRQLSSTDMVRFYVPRDPTSGDEQFFERSINGHVIRLRAGEVRTLPLWLVEYIEERITIQRISNSAYDEFKTKNGKLLQ